MKRGPENDLGRKYPDTGSGKKVARGGGNMTRSVRGVGWLMNCCRSLAWKGSVNSIRGTNISSSLVIVVRHKMGVERPLQVQMWETQKWRRSVWNLNSGLENRHEGYHCHGQGLKLPEIRTSDHMIAGVKYWIYKIGPLHMAVHVSSRQCRLFGRCIKDDWEGGWVQIWTLTDKN